MKILMTLILSAAPIAAAAQTETVKTMSFESCISNIQTISGQLGIVPVNIVETNDLRIVRFVTSDGNVLVTCSRPDRKMLLRMTN